MSDGKAKFRDLTAPVRKARDWIAKQIDSGQVAECPCCDRPVGYEQRFEKLHAMELLRFFRAARQQAEKYGGEVLGQGIHVPTVLGSEAKSYSQNCLSQLRYFGLVEPSGDKPGWWKLTAAGLKFIEGDLHVARAAWMFKSKLVHYVETAGTVGIRDLVPKPEYDSYMEEGQS